MKTLRRIHSTSESSASSLLPSPSSSWSHFRSLLDSVSSASPANSCAIADWGLVKSPWSRRKRKRALSPKYWMSMFTQDGKLSDGGVKLLKKVRSGGIDLSIREEVWPFLLGVYRLDSTKEERDTIKHVKRKEYERLRRKCRKLWQKINDELTSTKLSETSSIENGSRDLIQRDLSDSEDVVSARDYLSSEEGNSDVNGATLDPMHIVMDTDNYTLGQTMDQDASAVNDVSSCSDSSVESVINEYPSPFAVDKDESGADLSSWESSGASKTEVRLKVDRTENFATWQRIIRVDAVRANWDFLEYASSQSRVSECKACRSAEVVGLKGYSHLEPSMILHAARLVAILEAYALYDPDIGYCQGMSDLLSPIITVMSSNYEAFWCFVAFMRKARNNFRLDETLCLWEVMWADQAAVKCGIGKSAWSKIRQRVPPTEDLLLYAIAACVLQRRKLIIEKYNSMDDIIRECNNMAGNLDVWKLLDDAHNLVMVLHSKVETSAP